MWGAYKVQEMPRKRTMIRVTVTLRQEHLDEVDQLADKLDIPRSAAVRILIMEALEQREPQKMTIQMEQRGPNEPQHVAMAIKVEKPEPDEPQHVAFKVEKAEPPKPD